MANNVCINKKTLTDQCGSLWWVSASYKFCNPVGIIGHIIFFVQFPFATYRYLRMNNG